MFYDIGSQKGRQIDRAFVMREHQHMVERCVNAAMIVDSDHESVRVKMAIRKMAPVAKTMRKNRTGKDVSSTYGPEAGRFVDYSAHFKAFRNPRRPLIVTLSRPRITA